MKEHLQQFFYIPRWLRCSDDHFLQLAFSILAESSPINCQYEAPRILLWSANHCIWDWYVANQHETQLLPALPFQFQEQNNLFHCSWQSSFIHFKDSLNASIKRYIYSQFMCNWPHTQTQNFCSPCMCSLQSSKCARNT